jgi:hypothetical protein
VKKVVKPAAQIGATLAAAAEVIAEPRAAEIPAQAAPVEEPEIESEVIDITDVAPPKNSNSDPFANFMREALPSTAAQPTAEPELAPKPEPVPEPETEQFVSSSPATSTLDDADADPFPEPEFFDELLRDDPPKVDPVTKYPDPDRTG